MATRNNSKLVAAITAMAVGALYLDRQVTNLADRGFIPPNLANADAIQIGVVPAGMVLVPQLCTLQVPVLDSNGAATGKYKIGSLANAAALCAEKGAGTANVYRGSDFDVTAKFGSATDDTPIYLTLSAGLATQAAAGKIVADFVMRAFVPAVDA